MSDEEEEILSFRERLQMFEKLVLSSPLICCLISSILYSIVHTYMHSQSFFFLSPEFFSRKSRANHFFGMWWYSRSKRTLEIFSYHDDSDNSDC